MSTVNPDIFSYSQRILTQYDGLYKVYFIKNGLNMYTIHREKSRFVNGSFVSKSSY